MTGRVFIRLITKRGIPLSCIADKLNYQLSTLRKIEKMEQVPKHILFRFVNAFKDSLEPTDIEMLAC